MKAFLLAAGAGTRLRPYTDHVPKCMVPVCGQPLLDIWLQLCAEHGIDEVLINIHAHADQVRAHVSSRPNPVRVHLFEEETLLGNGGTIRENRAWVKSESVFWVFYADVLTNVNLSEMLDFHRAHPSAATLGVYKVPNPAECGIVAADDQGVIQTFVEKPVKPPANTAFSGVLLATRELLQILPENQPCDLGFHVLPRLTGRMRAFPIRDYLMDIGTVEKYQLAQQSWPGFRPRAQRAPC